MGSELLEKLAGVDAKASGIVAAAREEAAQVEASLGAEAERLESAAEAALAAELAARGAELAKERERELGGIEAAKREELARLAAVPAGRVEAAAELAARALTDR